MAAQRQFTFFEKITDAIDTSQALGVFKTMEPFVCTSGKNSIIMSDILLQFRVYDIALSGWVHMVNGSFDVRSFVAYERGRVTHLKHLKQRNVLVTIGEEDNMVQIIKLWNMDKIDPETHVPAMERAIKVQQPSGNSFPVTCMAVLETLTQIAVGLANGTVVLIYGDLMRDKTAGQRPILQNDEPITGLGFKEQPKGSILYIATTAKLMTYHTFTKTFLMLDEEQGGALGCVAMNELTHELAVARDDAFFFYTPDDRGPAYAFQGPKTHITFFKSYLVSVSPPAFPFGNSKSHSQSASSDPTRLTILDPINKLVAYSGTFAKGIRGIFWEWDTILVVENDGKLTRLKELDTSVKLDILFRKNMYVLAINLAHNQKYDNASLAEIIKKYGDHLYEKGDFDGAMTQYIRTIGHLEPSFVIRKFLDAQRIYNLASYLLELHSAGLAIENHTALLINCYTKLKDVKRLDEFIKTDAAVHFDNGATAQVCRQAGYYEYAVYLAEKRPDHDLYLAIQIDDLKQYDQALVYMRKLRPEVAEVNLRKYGKVLLTQLPEQTTQLLVDLCSGTLGRGGRSVSPSRSASPRPYSPRPQSPAAATTVTISSQVGVGTPQQGFGARQLGLGQSPTQSGANSPNPDGGHSAMFQAPQARSEPPVRNDQYGPPSLRTFMSLFVDHPAAALSPRIDGGDRSIMSDRASSVHGPGRRGPKDREMEERKAIWDTLLELYLADPPLTAEQQQQQNKGPIMAAELNRRSTERIKRKEKCMNLLRDTEIPYDANHALVLCHLAGFDEGIVFLYEKMKMYTDILRFWIGKDNTAKVVECLRQYGQLEPSLYPLTLSYLSSSPERLSSATSELLKVLDHIDQNDLLPPLQVVQALSQTSVATIGMIKNYIGRRIEAERKERLEDHKQIQSYRAESEAKRRETEELKTSARVFQVTKCSACGATLDLPSVHFLCRHSYHQRCLPDGADRECPRCMVEQRTVADIRRTQEANAERHDLFQSELEDADDGFAVVAKYFGNNTMAFAKLVD
ncbi:hypothetical protein BGZ73_000089 [Actinomortierella ambigua]|nr:hypothetical protein BGZ73_000089 [Actinomortierella ambigua]